MNKLTTAALATIVLVFAFAKVSNATIRRCGYWGTPTALDYSSLQNAYNASVAGDTLMVYPNNSGWGIQTVTHKVVILGNGRSWDAFSDYGSIIDTVNKNMQTLYGHSNVATIYFGAGSDSSVVSGLVFNTGACYIGAINYYTPVAGVKSVNGIKVERCLFFNNNGIYLEGNNNGCKIIGNYFVYGSINCNYTGNNYATSNLTVSNNIFRPAGTSIIIKQYGLGLTGVLKNNIFRDPLFQSTYAGEIIIPTGAMMIENNISNGLTTLNAPNCLFHNNIGTGTEWPTNANYGSGNLQNIPYSSLFVNSFNNSPTLSPEARFVLKAGSPAIGYYYGGASSGSSDAGIFGGPTPHAINGTPAAPIIYKVSGPSNQQSNGGTLQLTISAKTLN